MGQSDLDGWQVSENTARAKQQKSYSVERKLAAIRSLTFSVGTCQRLHEKLSTKELPIAVAETVGFLRCSLGEVTLTA